MKISSFITIKVTSLETGVLKLVCLLRSWDKEHTHAFKEVCSNISSFYVD